MASRDPFVKFTKYKGYLNEKTYTDVWDHPEEIEASPLTPRDCFLVCQELKEKTRIPGFEIVGTPEYSKDREVDCVVLASGPGYRIRNGTYPFHYDGQLVMNQTKRGDIVRFLERVGNPIQKGGKTYYLIEEHKLYFAIDR